VATGYSAIIWAAGCFNLTEKLGGKSVISHSIDPFDADDACLEVLLLVDQATQDWIKSDPLTFTSAKQRLLLVDGLGLASLPTAVEQARGELVLINDASRPNFGELAQAVLKQAGPGGGCAPYMQLAMLGAPVQLTEGEGAVAAKTDNFFGPAKQAPTRQVSAHVELTNLALLQTPQAYPRAELLAALQTDAQLAQRQPGDYAAIYLAHGGKLKAVAGLAGNVNLVDEDAQRLLLKLMGGPARKQKDRYGGLGW
jgi:2-C-methyl-D-erythritol 4-phosphate cytidylyltransferase